MTSSLYEFELVASLFVSLSNSDLLSFPNSVDRSCSAKYRKVEVRFMHNEKSHQSGPYPMRCAKNNLESWKVFCTHQQRTFPKYSTVMMLVPIILLQYFLTVVPHYIFLQLFSQARQAIPATGYWLQTSSLPVPPSHTTSDALNWCPSCSFSLHGPEHMFYWICRSMLCSEYSLGRARI